MYTENLLFAFYVLITKCKKKKKTKNNKKKEAEVRHKEGTIQGKKNFNIDSVQSLSHVRLFVTPWTSARQASLSIANSRSLLKIMSIESVMPSNHLIFCHPLFLLPSIFSNIRVFSNESVLHIRWPKY